MIAKTVTGLYNGPKIDKTAAYIDVEHSTNNNIILFVRDNNGERIPNGNLVAISDNLSILRLGDISESINCSRGRYNKIQVYIHNSMFSDIMLSHLNARKSNYPFMKTISEEYGFGTTSGESFNDEPLDNIPHKSIKFNDDTIILFCIDHNIYVYSKLHKLYLFRLSLLHSLSLDTIHYHPSKKIRDKLEFAYIQIQPYGRGS